MRRLPALLLLASAAGAQQDSARQALDLLLRTALPSRPPANGRINTTDKTWEDWVRRTGELPPDFGVMPSVPELPDPLVLREGGRAVPISTPEQWQRQRRWMREQFEQWVFGRMPPPPGNLRARVTSSAREGRVTVREVLLEFGPDHRARLRLQVIVPDGAGPFPVFLTNHARNRPWIYTAVRRGYLVCVYHATDPRYGNGDDSDAYIDVYPEYDFSCLARWAWSASRAVDYLDTLPEVDKGKIGLAGHSRNGKQALLAAAFDERIGAVVPSSGNSGECDPWRYTTPPFVNESVELLTGAMPHWFHPRLRFFAGREDKLPVDQHMLLALTAPRGAMLYTGYAESAGNPVGFEQAYRSALRVYRFLGREENLWLHLRDGEHATTDADIENFIDFFDSVFGRARRPKSETWIHGYTFDGWQRITGETVDPSRYPAQQPGAFASGLDTPGAWRQRQAAIRNRIHWALGEEPPALPPLPLRELPAAPPDTAHWLEGLFRRPSSDRAARMKLEASGIGLAEIPYGDGLKADLFFHLAKKGRLPLVVWLHPYSYQAGWSIASPWMATGVSYRVEQRPSFPALIERGFAVLAFDQIGFGMRVRDARDFYTRYPKWSLMGKMVADTLAAVEAAAALDRIDAGRIYLMGYSLGAKVGLFAAALDDRIRGVAAVCGFDPLRLATEDRGVEGVRHYSHLHGLLPRLGFFVGHEARLPLDFDEVLAMAAPRPVLVVAPKHDRYARIGDVRRAVESSRAVYRLLGAEGALTLDTPEDFNGFPRATQQRVFDWLARLP